MTPACGVVKPTSSESLMACMISGARGWNFGCSIALNQMGGLIRSSSHKYLRLVGWIKWQCIRRKEQ